MPFRIDHAKVGDWCAAYDGPPFHACLCDPPYEIGFMSKKWDATGVAFRPETWAAIGEHLLPGAFLMAFGGSRTFHRLTCAIEDAGYIIHPAICWLYGSGFPKATRIDTQVDKAAGAERETVGSYTVTRDISGGSWADLHVKPNNARLLDITAPATPLAAAWAGHRYGLQALKPAAEFICVAQKPYAGRPVDSITATGAGALWVDGGRIGTGGETRKGTFPNGPSSGIYGDGLNGTCEIVDIAAGRWPANLALDSVAAEALGRQSGELTSGGRPDSPIKTSVRGIYGGNIGVSGHGRLISDTGTAARFFFQAQWSQIDDAEPFLYCAKSSRRERDSGLDAMPLVTTGEREGRQFGNNSPTGKLNGSGNLTNGTGRVTNRHNPHPCVKPISLARWLATLLLPPAEYAPRRILVPFAGSGSEMIGAGLAGWEEIVGIEQDADNCEIARARLTYWLDPLQAMKGD